jgi:Family of unknown function (DUF6492)
MIPDKISIVMVLKEFTHSNGTSFNNLERFMRIGMRTYQRFLNPDAIADFFVIVPKTDFNSIKSRLLDAYPEWPWRVIVEDVIVSKSVPGGWAKQQTAKLAIASMVKTSHYLIVDDDTYLTRPLPDARGLFDEQGRALMNKCDIDFPFFFLWSAQALGVDWDMVQNAPFHMAITPEIFVTDVVKRLIVDLEVKHGSHMKWQDYLAEHKFTEYCLYWIYLISCGEREKWYACDSAQALYAFATTGPEHDMPSQVRNSFNSGGGGHFFSFVQSSLSHTVDDVEEQILKYL